MLRIIGGLLLILTAGGLVALVAHGQRGPAPAEPEDRIAAARVRAEPLLRKLCADRELPYPPREIYLRALKTEQRLEVWARERGPFKLLKQYPFTVFSGELGPKRREGDRQIPEGLYVVDRFNPRSLFHLSLGLNYPNASDRVLSDPERPGFDIFIHGNDVSVGCIAIGDPAVEEVFLLAWDTRVRGQTEIPVHIFPAAMNGDSWQQLLAEQPEKAERLRDFWQDLATAFRGFEETREVPRFTVDSAGRYVLEVPASR